MIEPLTAREMRAGFASALYRATARPLLRIAMEVEDDTGVTIEELKGKSRLKTLVEARQWAYARSREETSASLTEIGRFYGHRDHTTIIHGIRSHKRRIGITEEN